MVGKAAGLLEVGKRVELGLQTPTVSLGGHFSSLYLSSAALLFNL